MKNKAISFTQAISPEPKQPQVRFRNNLTSIQIDDNQKQAIDQAYKLFVDSGAEGLTKGDFLEAISLAYIKAKGNPESLERGTDELGAPQGGLEQMTGSNPLNDSQIMSA